VLYAWCLLIQGKNPKKKNLKENLVLGEKKNKNKNLKEI
jgi:hypothetical protein